MPGMEIRGRYMLREYWGDSALFLKLTSGEREVYMGMWMLADDAGWMPRDIPAIAAALFRFEAPSQRESRVKATVGKLVKLRKVISYRCGCLEIPVVRRYPRPGNKSDAHLAWHRAQHDQSRSNGSNDVQTSSVTTLPNPTRSIPSLPTARARAHEEGEGPTRGGPPRSAKDVLDERWKRGAK